MLRWGVVGTGGIAQRFATAMELCDRSKIVAVASRSLDAAGSFGDRFGVERRYSSVGDLAVDPEVDVVYIATPNHRHHLDSIAMLDAGKHVLCEKPFALDRVRADSMVEAARRNDRFLMEAIWSRFLPSYRRLQEILDSGIIGRIRAIDASFGFAAPVMPEHRLFDLSKGGGSLLDLGIYPLQLASFVVGTPDRIEAVGDVGSTGVDEMVAMVLHHPCGAIGSLRSAIRVNLPNDARIMGESGSIEIPMFMHCPDRLVVHTARGSETIDSGFEGDGLRFQIEEVERCLLAGLRESATIPLAETLQLATTMDAIRVRLGVEYPDDQAG